MKDIKKIIGSVVILIIFVIFLFVGYIASRPTKPLNSKEVFKEENTIESKDTKQITIYVNGEVKKPGVYQLKSDSRVEDLVKMAGGFTENADSLKLNLAKKLKDEDYICVDKKGEVKGGSSQSNSATNSGISQEGKVNINKASKEELKTIPGVGDVTAQKIIEYREKNGGFSSVEDLKKVGRIGDKTLEKIKDKVDIR